MPYIDDYDWAEEGQTVVCVTAYSHVYTVGEQYKVTRCSDGTLCLDDLWTGNGGEWKLVRDSKKPKGLAAFIKDTEGKYDGQRV